MLNVFMVILLWLAEAGHGDRPLALQSGLTRDGSAVLPLVSPLEARRASRLARTSAGPVQQRIVQELKGWPEDAENAKQFLRTLLACKS